MRSQNFDERLGRVRAADVALLVGDQLKPITLEDSRGLSSYRRPVNSADLQQISLKQTNKQTKTWGFRLEMSGLPQGFRRARVLRGRTCSSAACGSRPKCGHPIPGRFPASGLDLQRIAAPFAEGRCRGAFGRDRETVINRDG